MKQKEYSYGQHSIRVVEAPGDPFYCMGDWQIPDIKKFEVWSEGKHKKTFETYQEALSFID